MKDEQKENISLEDDLATLVEVLIALIQKDKDLE